MVWGSKVENPSGKVFKCAKRQKFDLVRGGDASDYYGFSSSSEDVARCRSFRRVLASFRVWAREL